MKKTFFLLITVFSLSLYAQDSDMQSQKQSNPMAFQPIAVTIGGNFIVTGSFTASKLQRLDSFISAAYTAAEQKALGSLTKIETIKQVSTELKKYPLRDITLKRINGEIRKIDLMKFRLTGDFSNNPYLQNDDVIIFPEYDLKQSFVDVMGAVNKEVKFQFVEGDNLSDALLFAGGVNPAFENIRFVEISRLNSAGNKEELIKADIKSNFPLKRGDRLTVLSDENQRRDFKVLVLGEVRKPGYVYVTKNSTTIREVIKKAGGFTDKADLRRSEFLNGTDESQLQKMNGLRTHFEKDSSFTTLPIFAKTIEELLSEEVLMSRSHNLLLDQFQSSFFVDNAIRFINNQNSVNFEAILQENSEDGNLIVKEGDMIIVPAYQNKVYVFGQVMNPGFYSFEPKKDLKYYIDKAGGKTETAVDDEEINLIKGTNRTWILSEHVREIESGDLVYVPKNIRKGFDYYLQQVGSFTSILMSVISLTFLIVQISK